MVWCLKSTHGTQRSTGFFGAWRKQRSDSWSSIVFRLHVADDAFRVKIFEEEGILNAPSSRIAVAILTRPLTASGIVPSLPNPEYIRIHAAIADILNVSGAGNFFFDELLNTKMMKARFPLCDRDVSSKSWWWKKSWGSLLLSRSKCSEFRTSYYWVLQRRKDKDWSPPSRR